MPVGKINVSDIKLKAVMVGAAADNAGRLFAMDLLAALLAVTGLPGTAEGQVLLCDIFLPEQPGGHCCIRCAAHFTDPPQAPTE